MSADHGHKFDPANVARLDDPARLRCMPPAPLVRALAPGPADRIADVGCGSGYWLRALLDGSPAGTRFFGVDTEPAMLEHLAKRLQDHPRRQDVQVVQSTEHSIPLADGSIDAAVLGAVYHELADRPGYLRELHRLLAPGGRLAIVDWDALPDGAERTAGPPLHERIPCETARAELLAAGFEDPIRVEGFIESYALIVRRQR